MRDEYHFRAGESDRCPACGDTMEHVGEIARISIPGAAVNIWVCDSDPCHRWLEVDGEFQPYYEQ